jgi:hypothetical protein
MCVHKLYIFHTRKSIYLSTSIVDFGGFFSFLIYTQSAGLLGWGSVPRKVTTCIHRTSQTLNKRTQTSMPQVGFEPTNAVFEGTKTVYASDRAAAVICGKRK